MKTARTYRGAAPWAALCLIAVAAAPLRADTRPAESLVELSLPENLSLKVLIDYVGTREGLNFIYDDQVVNKQVTIKAPRKLPAASLITLLESALKMKGLVLVPSEVPGMMRIEMARELTAFSVGPAGAEETPERPTLAVTRAFALQHATPARVAEVVKPFLSAATANFTPLPEHGMVIITDYAPNLGRIEELVALVDRPQRDVAIRFVPVEHVSAASVADKIKLVLAGKAKARSGEAGRTTTDGAVTALPDDRTNRVALIGPAGEVEEITALVRSLDVPLGLDTRLYRLRVASPDRVDRLVRKTIGEGAAERLYESATDYDANLLIVTATPEIHKTVEALQEALDKPMAESQSPIRFYKLENAKAVEVLNTLQNIEGETGLKNVSLDAASPEEAGKDEAVSRGPTPDAVNRRGALSLDDLSAESLAGDSLALPDARVMADEPTNTIIVIAKPAVQTIYAALIRQLDVRRPQVLVEATVVALDTSDGFSLGVEISRTDELGDDRGTTLNFSSFGLSTVDADTGRLSIRPGIGFNGAVISADIADVVVRALQSDSRARVVSRPSVLINDNAEGELISENEEPFKSINAFTSGTTTESFAGYSSAGTKILLEPQISEGDHLMLRYEITLSSFGDEGASESLPPSRQSNVLRSEATIPDGYTIVVGGLSRRDSTNTVDRVPLLGSIPVLEYFFSNRSRDVRETTLFVFIRAVILRDDKFKDLKFISDDAARRAEIAEGFPESEPVEMQ